MNVLPSMAARLLSVRSWSIYAKLLVTFGLVVVPLYLVSLYINVSGEASVKREIAQSMASKTAFYGSALETEIKRINRLKREYVNDEDFLQLSTASAFMDTYTRQRTILEVQNKLRLLQYSSPFVADVRIYMPDLGRSIFANNLNDFIPDDEIAAVRAATAGGLPLLSWKDRILNVHAVPVMSGELVYALEIELSPEEIRKSLGELAAGKTGGAVLYDAKGAWQVQSGPEAAEAREWMKLLPLPEAGQPGSRQLMVDIGGEAYFVDYRYSPVLDAVLAAYVPQREFLGALKRYRTWLRALTALSLLLVVFFSYRIHLLIQRPIRRMVAAFRKVEKGDMDVSLRHAYRDEFEYMYRQFNTMVSRIRTLITEVYEQQIHAQRSELKQLQSQINPHFLYNSFYVLKKLIQMEDHKASSQMADYLGSYFQFLTRDYQDDIPLQAELQHARSYLDIQLMRFSKRLRAEIELDAMRFVQLSVPRLIVQPVVENAFEHGLRNKITGAVLRVAVDESAGLRIVVEDNGEELSEGNLDDIRDRLSLDNGSGETTGLLNVHRRLRLKFGSGSGIVCSRSPLGGLRVEMIITEGERSHA